MGGDVLGRIEELHFGGGKDGGILPAACRTSRTGRTGQTSRSAYRPQTGGKAPKLSQIFQLSFVRQSVYALSVLYL